MSATKVECSTCSGTGRAPLSDVLMDTLRVVRGLGGVGTTATDAARNLRTSTTTQNNRLEALRAVGLVTRSRDGRQWRYRPGKERVSQ